MCFIPRFCITICRKQTKYGKQIAVAEGMEQSLLLMQTESNYIVQANFLWISCWRMLNWELIFVVEHKTALKGFFFKKNQIFYPLITDRNPMNKICTSSDQLHRAMCTQHDFFLSSFPNSIRYCFVRCIQINIVCSLYEWMNIEHSTHYSVIVTKLTIFVIYTFIRCMHSINF